MGKLSNRLLKNYTLEPFYIQKKGEVALKIISFIFVYAMINFVIELFFTGFWIVTLFQVLGMSFIYTISLILIQKKRLILATNLIIGLGFGFGMYLFFEPVPLRFYNQMLMVLLTVTAGYIVPFQIHMTSFAFVLMIMMRITYALLNEERLPGTIANHMLAFIGALTLGVCIFVLKQKIDSEFRISSAIKHEMENDSLTHLPNRRKFEAVFYNGFAHEQMAYLIMDLDFFKRVNDRYGHQTGDEILKQFATILKSSIRNSDMAFRWGGEEFAVILAGVDIELASSIAERIRVNIEQFDFGLEDSITVSIGMVHIASNKTEREMRDLFILADKALYQAKEEGRNRVICQ